MHLLIWAGPVSQSNLRSARLPAGTEIVTVNEGDGGISSTAFSRLGARVRSLAGLLVDRGVSIELTRCETVTLAGFSAAHGLFEQLLRDPTTFARVDALAAFDAYYTGADLTVKRGYRAFCDRAAQGRALAVLTTSDTGGPNYPSAQAAVAELVKGLPLRERPPPPRIPPPQSTRTAGGLIWLDYAGRYKHVQHATEIAPRVLSEIVTPYLEGRRDGSSPELALLGLGLLFVVAGGA